jgi:hypothetical protein
MTKLAKVELLVPSKQRRPGHPAKVTKLRRVSIEVVKPDSFEQAMEDLLIFDARMLDRKARQELLCLLPRLVHVGRFWAARFAEKGCLCCHRKKVSYAAGGLCVRCQARERHSVRQWCSKRFAGRDVDEEVTALTRRFAAAQMLFNGGDE